MSAECERAALVEAMFDGRLGPSERASTERHLKSCAACAELLRDLTALPVLLRSSSIALSPLEHQRARLALLRRTAGPLAKKRRPIALVVAAVVALPLAAWASIAPISPLHGWGAPTTAAHPAPAQPRKQAARSPISMASTAPAPATTATLSPPLEVTHLPAVSPTSASVLARREPSAKIAWRAESVAPRASRASLDFAAAMTALSRGDFGASASQLEAFAHAHARDPRAEDAAYLEAIALERAGRVAEAKTAALRYLAVYPEGAHHARARRIADR